MPLPKPKKDEPKKEFLSRCMGDDSMVKEFENPAQRYAICINQSKAYLLQQVCAYMDMDCCYDEDDEQLEDEETIENEELTMANIIVPEINDYIEVDEPFDEFDVSTLARYKYTDPTTNEIYYFDRMNTYKKDGRPLVYVGKSSEYQGRKVTLNKPFRTPNGPKKFAVYVKNNNDKVIIVRFGDPNMKIKKYIPERRRSFRARHRCDQQKDKTTPAYWSCKMW